jgi:hypothetical protein
MEYSHTLRCHAFGRPRNTTSKMLMVFIVWVVVPILLFFAPFDFCQKITVQSGTPCPILYRQVFERCKNKKNWNLCQAGVIFPVREDIRNIGTGEYWTLLS